MLRVGQEVVRNLPWLYSEAYVNSRGTSSRPWRGNTLPSGRQATGGIGVRGIEQNSQSFPA
jgi:hypothetical protein